MRDGRGAEGGMKYGTQGKKRGRKRWNGNHRGVDERKKKRGEEKR